jgi:hypothetical protein
VKPKHRAPSNHFTVSLPIKKASLSRDGATPSRRLRSPNAEPLPALLDVPLYFLDDLLPCLVVRVAV